MSMDKYGVKDKAGQQREELAHVRATIARLRTVLEKTATETSQLSRLEQRESELLLALDEH